MAMKMDCLPKGMTIILSQFCSLPNLKFWNRILTVLLSFHRAKIETSSSHLSTPSSSALQLSEMEAFSSNAHVGADSKNVQLQSSESKMTQDKNKPSHRDLSRSSAADSSSEDTSSLSHIPSCSKDNKDSRNSMSPASSRNRSPVSDKVSPSASQNKKKTKGRLNRQSSVDSDASDKAKFARR